MHQIMNKGWYKRCVLRELPAGVDGLALAVEVGVAHAVGVVVAAVGIALASEAIIRVSTTAVGASADVVVVVRAGVGSEGKGVGVGLPGGVDGSVNGARQTEYQHKRLTRYRSQHSRLRGYRHRRWGRWWRAPSRRWPIQGCVRPAW